MTIPKNVTVTASSRGVSEAQMELNDAFRLVNPDDRWMELAKCHGDDAVKWFPAQGERHLISVAKRYCADCPVRQSCLDYALDNSIAHGVWGGRSPSERKRVVKSRQYKGKMGL